MTEDEERVIREKIEADWLDIETVKEELTGYVQQLCARLSRESGVRHRHWVEARSKTISSILRKLNEKSLGLDQMYGALGDLIGARVVVYNLSDAKALRTALMTEGGSISNTTDEDILRPSGYRAIHINGRIGQYGCEIQIRTVVQDAWAVTSRADVYRSDTDILVSTLSGAQASILQGVDEVLQAVRDLTERSRGEVSDAKPEPANLASLETDKEVLEPQKELDGSLVAQARDDLETSERYVLESPVSQTRVDALRAGIESERQTGEMGRIFRAASRYERTYQYKADSRFGNRMTVWKGPFVEGSSWAEFQPTDFSRGLEAFLQFQFGDALRSGLDLAPHLDSWEDASNFISDTIVGIKAKGGRSDLVVMQGRAGQEFEMDMLRSATWSDTERIRGVDLWGSRPHGPVVHGLPLLRILGVEEPPSLHIVDLDEFHYEQTNPDAMSDSDLYLNLEPYSFETALEATNKHPQTKQWLYRASHQQQDGEYSREETVVRLLLQVKLHVIEGGRIERRSSGISRAATLPTEPKV